MSDLKKNRAFAYLEQEPCMFEMNLRENIRLGMDVSDELVENAAWCVAAGATSA